MSDPEAEGKASRRQILRGGVAGALGVAAGATAAGCGDGRADPDAVTRVPVERLPLGERVRIDHHGEPVIVLRSRAGIEARSLICTHERCQLFWHPTTEVYRCPCHPTTFSPDGRALSGPASEPMWRLPARLEGDTVVIGGA